MWSDDCPSYERNSHSTGKITRYASPNRYDSMDAPASFLDKRLPRSRSTAFRKMESENSRVESSMPQSYETSGSAIIMPHRISNYSSLPNTTRHKVETDHTKKLAQSTGLSASGGSVLDRMSDIENRLERMKLDRQKEQKEAQRHLLNHQIGVNNSSHVNGDIPVIYTSQYSEDIIVDKLSESQVNSFFTPAQTFHGFNNNRSGSFKDDFSLDSGDISTRALIQTNVAEQSKMLTYDGDMIESSTNLEVTDHLDNLASKLGLLDQKELARPITSDIQPDCVHDNNPSSSLTTDLNSSTTPKLRGSRGSLLGNLLRRLSPRLKRRSKSFSPSRLTSSPSNNTGGGTLPQSSFSTHNMRDAGGNSKSSTLGSNSQASTPNSQTSSTTSRSLLRFFSKKHRKSMSSGGQTPISSAIVDTSVLGSAGTDRAAYNGSDSQLSDTTGASNISIDPSTRSRKSSANSAQLPSWQTSIAVDNRRLLNALETDRVNDPYSQFKRASSRATPGPTSTTTPIKPVSIQMKCSSQVSSETVALNNTTPPAITQANNCKPQFFTFNQPDNFPPAPTSPRYLALSLSAFGYSNYKPSHLSTVPNSAPPVPKTTDAAGCKQEGAYSPSPTSSTPSAYHYNCGRKDSVDSMNPPRRKKTRSTSEEKEARHRSSLIMLTVTQASPRVKLPLSSTHHFGQLSFDSTTYDLETQPHTPRPQLVRQMTSPPSFSSGVPSVSSPDRLPPLLDDEDQVATEEEIVSNGEASEEKDGRHYLTLVAQSEAVLREMIEATEKDIRDVGDSLPEEVSGQLRTAAGKASLLISEKFAQFRGLCDQNLRMLSHATGGEVEGPEFLTLSSDLEGFWAMVLLQVEDVTRGFREIETLRENNWVVLQPPPSPKTATQKKTKKRVTRPSTVVSGAPVVVDPARIEARKRLLAAKRQALQNMKLSNCSQKEDFVIYT